MDDSTYCARSCPVKPAGVVYLVVRVMLVVGQAVRACRGSVLTS
ncbi:hypothetical protein [uncultured Pseudokineococcus sp.]|nr:hypothetical protein [uncultured Pseudokineococcus sp.]